MSIRDKIIIGALNVVLAIVVGLLARVGLPVPPVVITPADLPPPVVTPKPQEPQPDPLQAIVRIGRSNVGCSATIIGPRRADGRFWALSAAHCCDKIGERWQARFRDGRTTGLQVVALNRQSDFAWMLTDVSTEAFPFALLSDADPQPGDHVWHAGYGVDKPANREDGQCTAGRNADGQIEYRLSVSSGDSGGGICLDSSGRVLSPVCCGTDPGRVGRVWGCSPVVAKRGQTVAARVEEWTPLPLPKPMDVKKE